MLTCANIGIHMYSLVRRVANLPQARPNYVWGGQATIVVPDSDSA